MNKTLFTKKNGIILRITMLAILCFGLFSCSNNESINVKKEVENIYKLEEQGKKYEARERLNALFGEVDKLIEAEKDDEAEKLFKEISDEVDKWRKKNPNFGKKKIFNFEGLNLTPKDDPAF